MIVNNAGVGQAGGMLDTSLEDLDWVIGINLWGVIHGCHFFVPNMVKRAQGGHVVNVSSVFGFFAPPGSLGYCTAKFGVFGMSESLRGE
ncbi:MAG TPA: SDR family NAD(P)-dependent oxidoreductase, partial [Polyangiaceae bacterium]